VEITRSAHHGRAELVVLGRHEEKERSWRDRLLGTTAERVIRNGDVSVLVVAEPAKAPYRRPLVAVDMSQSSRLALQLALRLQLALTIDAHFDRASVSDPGEPSLFPISVA
jgi:nucleotide-binding universal stress UspA family protein